MTSVVLDLVIKPVSLGFFISLFFYQVAKQYEDRPDAVPAGKGAVALGLMVALGVFALNYWKKVG